MKPKYDKLLPRKRRMREEKTGVALGYMKIAQRFCKLCKAQKGWVHLYKECI